MNIVGCSFICITLKNRLLKPQQLHTTKTID